MLTPALTMSTDTSPSPTASSPAVPPTSGTGNGDIDAREEKAIDKAIQEAEGAKLTLNIKVSTGENTDSNPVQRHQLGSPVSRPLIWLATPANHPLIRFIIDCCVNSG